MTPMRSVADIYAAARAAGRQPVSFEIFPPKGDLTLEAAHEVAADDALVQAALAFAREEGLFRRSQPPQDEEQGLVVLWARRLDCDVVQDGPTCEQTLWEVAMPTADGGEQRGWCVYLSAV